jgi:hypothetical protein
MTERYSVTLDEAKQFRAYHSKRWAEPCEGCEYAPLGALRGTDAEIDARGYELCIYRAGWFKRCAACVALPPPHAWLARIDLDRLQPWLQAQFDKHGDCAWVIDFDDLRRSCGRGER